MGVPARAIAPEWAGPTLFFGESRLGRRQGSGPVGRRTGDRGPRLRAGGRRDQDAPGSRIVRLFVDKEGGIGLDELQSVSEEVSAILDAEDPIPTAYTLEVSSPGLDRPLRGEADYRRFAGKLARLSSYEPVDGRRHWTGRLVAVDDGASVTLPSRATPCAAFPSTRSPTGASRSSSRRPAAARGETERWPISCDSRSSRSAGRRTSTPT